MRIDPLELSARSIAFHVARQEMKAAHVVRDTLDRVARVNPEVNAIVQDCADEAMIAAERLDQRLAAGEVVGPLAGVPVTVKVIADQRGFATTNGTKLGRDQIAQTDSPFLRNLRAKGAIVIGRTNTPAFSYRWFTSNAVHGTTFNPRNPELTPGGSSGGAGAAVASGMGHIGHGTDIAGSIRYPAYACGIHGLRPTPGRVPAFNHSVPDRSIGPQITAVSGPLARSVDDLRLGLEGMSGYAADDPWSVPAPLRGPEFARRVALVRRPSGLDVDPRILEDLEAAAGVFRDAGWQVETPDAPDLREAAQMQIDLWICDQYQAKVDMAEAEGDPGAFAILRHHAERAAQLDLPGFSALFQRRSFLMRQWRAFLEDYPVVLMPVSGELPFLKDEDLSGPERLAEIWEAQLPQVALPLLGMPCVSVATTCVDNVPGGVQLLAPPWREDICLDAAEVLERGFGRPTVCG